MRKAADLLAGVSAVGAVFLVASFATYHIGHWVIDVLNQLECYSC